jgi:ZIP family zinc transporter
LSDFLTILAVAGAAGIASPLGGAIALWRKPTTLFMSIALGFASGVLLGAIAFEMLPQALQIGSLPVALGGFAAGFVAVYGFDLFVHRGQLAGKEAEQRPQIERFYQRHRPRGSDVTVLAGGTSAEELIEGLSIGVGTAIAPGLGLVIGLAIVVDNLSEALSIGELIVGAEGGERRQQVRRTLGWTSLIGVALLGSALVGWFFLRGLPDPVLGFLLATGAGAIFYLTIGDLVPEAGERHYQQSGTIATAAGFILIFALSSFSGDRAAGGHSKKSGGMDRGSAAPAGAPNERLRSPALLTTEDSRGALRSTAAQVRKSRRLHYEQAPRGKGGRPGSSQWQKYWTPNGSRLAPVRQDSPDNRWRALPVEAPHAASRN